MHGALLVLLIGYLGLPLDELSQRVWHDVTVLVAMTVGAWGLLHHRPAHRRGWLLLLLGYGGWAVGDLVWLLESVLQPPRFPALSDAIYLSCYGVIGAGVLMIVRTRRSGGDRAALLDAAILVTGATVLVAVFLIAPSVRDTGLGTAAKLASIAYPVGDLFLLGALARLATSPGARNSSYRLLLAALTVTTVTDSVWNILISLAGAAAIDRRWLNAGWLLAYLLLAAATCVPAMRLVAEPAPPLEGAPLGPRRILALSTGLLLPSAVLFTDGLDDGAVAWPIIAVGAAVMSVLVLLRFADLLSTVRQQALRLAALAHTDPLTGAPNRRTWDLELAQACRFAGDHGTRLAVAILDLDHFKAYNDTHGHQAGDQLLQQAVIAWLAALPHDATLARYGGEEFAVLLPGTSLRDAHRVILTLRAHTPSGQSFSAGIAEWSPDTDPNRLLAAADRALYRAKRGGRNLIATTPERLDLDLDFTTSS
ncbi:MAG TPA: GGDEF domain-containing protein [Pseudonocardia sp.]|nr:GGDEF domain-containing protein [Pseudonocardia sp.]